MDTLHVWNELIYHFHQKINSINDKTRTVFHCKHLELVETERPISCLIITHVCQQPHKICVDKQYCCQVTIHLEKACLAELKKILTVPALPRGLNLVYQLI